MSRRLLILLALLLAAIMVSGCCCCCGDRKYYSPGTYPRPTTYEVTIAPAPAIITPAPVVSPTILPLTTVVPTGVSG
jgi:hypothetical protein